MGFFFGRTNTHNATQKRLSRAAIRKVISRSAIRSLSASDELAAEEAVDKARGGDGKISVQQIDDALKKIELRSNFTATDRNGIVAAFKKHFNK